MVEELVTPDDRIRALDALGALANAVHAEILEAVAVADVAKDWRADGATSMATWLAYRYRLAHPTARDWVRVAHALAGLPLVRAAFVAGDVSFDQLRFVVRFATADDDRWLAEELPGLSAAQAETMAVARRRVKSDEAGDAHRRRHVWFKRHRDGLSERMTADLPNEVAATVRAALGRRAEAAGPDDVTGAWAPFAARCADALGDLCTEDLVAHADRTAQPDATVVVIHTRDDVAAGLATGVGIVDGRVVTDDAVHRLLCDTRIEFHIDDADGTTVGIGRRSQEIPRWLRRRVSGRDGWCCRWPGCDRRIRHLHHMRHWIAGGTTNASNLVGTCWFHHHLLHEGGWNATGNGDDEVVFAGPNGHSIRSRAGPVAA